MECRESKAGRVVAVMVAFGLLAGCSTVLGIEADREALPAGPDPAQVDGRPVPANWSCINDPPVPTSTGSVQLSLLFDDVTTASSSNSFVGDPVSGVTMQACRTLDFTCATPIANATSGADGMATITVPRGFDGYYEVRAPEGLGYPPVLVKRPPQHENESAHGTLTKMANLELGGALVGVTTDPQKGIAIVSAIDCNAVPSAGIEFSVGDLTATEQLVYLEKSVPTSSATMTDVTGSALVFNIPPGSVSVTAGFADNHRPIRTLVALARPGWITSVRIHADGTRRPAQ